MGTLTTARFLILIVPLVYVPLTSCTSPGVSITGQDVLFTKTPKTKTGKTHREFMTVEISHPQTLREGRSAML